MNIPERFDTEIWPWNTKLVIEHLNQEWFQAEFQIVSRSRKKINLVKNRNFRQ